MTIYIVGVENALATTETEPRVIGPYPKEKYKRALWLASSLVGRHEFAIKRGIVEEFKTYDDGKRVYARVLPASDVPLLADLDHQIEGAKARLANLMQLRRDMLAAIVPRASRVKVKVPHE